VENYNSYGSSQKQMRTLFCSEKTLVCSARTSITLYSFYFYSDAPSNGIVAKSIYRAQLSRLIDILPKRTWKITFCMALLQVLPRQVLLQDLQVVRISMPFAVALDQWIIFKRLWRDSRSNHAKQIMLISDRLNKTQFKI
jgi:hypothetical protein